MTSISHLPVPSPINVLVLEDNSDDAELMIAELSRTQFVPTWQRVDAEAAFLAGLDPAPDLILADYSLPQFDALRALHGLRERDLDIPFIIVSGSVGEDVAVEAMQQGATDYLLKDRLARLGSAVERALDQRRLREQKRSLDHQLHASERRFRSLIERAPDGIALIDASYLFQYVSPSSERIMGFAAHEILGRNPVEFTHPDDLPTLLIQLQDLVQRPGHVFTTEYRFRHKDGSWRWLESTISNLLAVPDIHAVALNYHDITIRKQAEQRVRESEARFSTMFYASPLGILVTSLSDRRIIDVNGVCFQLTGYTYDEMIGRTTKDLGLWVDLPERDRLYSSIAMQSRINGFEVRLRTKDGTIRHTLCSSERIELNGEGCLLSYIQDITERKQSEEYIRALVENSAEIISVLDADGTVRYVTPAQQRLLGLAEDQASGHLLHTIHPQDRPLLQSVLDTLEVGGTVANIELRLQHQNGSWRVFDSTITNLLSNPAVRGIVVNSHDITERKRFELELAHAAFHDTVTGLPNRTLFMDRLRHSLQRGSRSPETGCVVVFLDLDRFKTVNDSLGHTVGDRMLVEVSRRLEQCLRAGDTVARFGGDEFAVLLEDVTLHAAVIVVTDHILPSFQVPFLVDVHEMVTSASVGIAFCSPTIGPDEILRDADIAMYQAKRMGAGRYAIADPDTYATLRARLQLEADLRHALDRDEFVLHYQPKMHMDGRTMLGVEALIRWQHPQRGFIPPAEFISIAEETGLIVPIGTWVLRTACAQLRSWLDANMAPLVVSVNLSAAQFKQPGIALLIAAILEETGIPPHLLGLELTETILMEDAEATIIALQELRTIGISVLAIDDFGTGYSSLSYLQRFPVTEIKIDKSFVRDITTNVNNAAIATATIALARSLGIKTIAEGVEIEVQRAFLEDAGCDCFQGFLCSRPIPPDDLLAFQPGMLR